MTGLLSAWLVEVGLITYRGSKQGRYTGNPIAGLALPSEYVATFIVFGGLGLIPGQASRVAAVAGWGIVVATFLNLWDPATIGNAGGVAVNGGPSTKTAGNTTTVTPQPGGSA